MSEQKNSFLYIGENGKADWGVPEGYPYKEVGEKVIVPETVLNFPGDGFILNPFIFDPVAGETYSITYDGVIYECIAVEQNKGGNISVSVGNLALLGGKDTGEPFIIVSNNNQLGIFGSPNETHTISIEGIVSEVHPMSAEFLPESVSGGAFIVNVTMDENENYIADKTYSEISEALANGQIPYCIFGSAVFYMMRSDGLLTTYTESIWHYFLNIDPSSFNIAIIAINDNNGVIFENHGTITVTTP